MSNKCLLPFACLALAASTVFCGESPGDERLVVEPSRMELSGRRSHRIAVSLVDDSKTHVDVSDAVEFEVQGSDVVSVDRRGVVTANRDGRAKIVVRRGELAAEVTVTARDAETQTVQFRTDVIAALSRGGCNQGACHGSPQGKNGFRLSLRGFQPDLDWNTLTREDHRRRVNLLEPRQSLILQKALGVVSHQGGRRFQPHDAAFKTLLAWIETGFGEARTDAPPASPLKSLELLPSQRRLRSGSPTQQLIVRAHFANGEIRDVTDLSVFTMAADGPTSVTAGGMVEFQETAESAVLVRYLDKIETARLTYIDVDPSFRHQKESPVNVVDQHVFAKHQQLQLRASPLAGDGEFLRRVTLDLVGGLPTPAETTRFLASDASDKRARWIDELLERPEYAQFWALKWADVMRGNRETISERGVHNFQRYLIRCIEDDRPFNQVARQVLTSMGNTINEPAANFYRISRTPNEAAESFSQLLLGVRIRRARCHNHPYEAISQRDYFSLAAHFARVRIKGTRFGVDDEVVYVAADGEVKMPGEDEPLPPAAFGLSTKELGDDRDLRSGLAAWLTRDERQRFAKSVVNRVWAHLLGQGLVEPVDDFRDSNPPSNPALLDALTEKFVQSGYRFKPLIRLILNSKTYQLTSTKRLQQSPRAARAERYFTRPVIKLLSAEQLLDAISTATGVNEKFAGYPPGTRAIAVAEGAVDHKFLQAFTKPARDVACDCAREPEPGLNQVVHLLNNASLLDKVDSKQSRIAQWIREGKPPSEIVRGVYLATVTRYPNQQELELSLRHLKSAPSALDGLQDLQHALINSNEFLLRH